MPLGPVIEKAARMLRELRPQLGGGSAPIHLDDVTAALLPSRFRVRPGSSGAELEEERTTDVARTLLGRATPFVGRDPEMATLLGVLAQVEGESVARAVVVTGGPGLGKSRLREELVAKLRARDEPPDVWMAAAEPLGSGAPLGLLARGLRGALGLVEEADRERLLRRIARLVPEEKAPRVATFVGELLGMKGDAADVQLAAARREPALMAEQIQRAFVDLLDAACARGPVVLVLEDAHWADAPTMKLVETALRELAERPLLVAVFARPELEDAFPGLFSELSALRLTLGPLTTRACERLAREVLGSAEPEALKRAVQQAAGHPFFLEELLRALASGVVGTMPESLLAIVQARLETHDEEARRVMRAASVFGVVFWRAGVAAIAGGGREAEVQRRIDELTVREVFVRRAESRLHEQLELAFRHALVRDAAYAMLTDSDRALAHRLAGEWLEAAGETNQALLADHFELGGEKVKAIASWRAAAAYALDADDLAGALRFAERGLALGPAGEELGRLHLVHAEALRFRGDLARACDEGNAALVRLEAGSRDWLRALGVTLVASVTTGKLAEALELTEALATEGGERSDAFFMTAARAVSFLLGAGQREPAERLFALLPADADEPLLSARIHVARAMQAHVLRADTLTLGAEMALAAAAFDRAGDEKSACSARSNAGFARASLGRTEEAEKLLRDALAGAKQRGAANVAAWAAHMLGLVVDVEEAIALEKEALAAAKQQGDKRLLASAGVAHARLLLGIRSHARAEEAARRALEAAGGTPSLRASALAVLADVLVAKGEHEQALRVADEAAVLLAEGAALEDAEPWVRAAHAEALHANGRAEDAARAIGDAKARLDDQVSRLPTDEDRVRFRERVPIHARILHRAASWPIPQR
jgi:tetratricopeptide (TPR) repeat protein